MEENKQLAEYIFYNRPNKQVYNFSWGLECLESAEYDEKYTWERPTHSRFLAMADKLLEVVGFEVAKKIIDLKLYDIY